MNGATIGSTDDVFEALAAAEAEALAVSAWKAVEPGYGFRPLLTIERR